MKTIRFKTNHGVIASFGYHQGKDGKWRLATCGNVKNGCSPVPTAFIPFELSNAVINAPSFDFENECISYIRAL